MRRLIIALDLDTPVLSVDHTAGRRGGVDQASVLTPAEMVAAVTAAVQAAFDKKALAVRLTEQHITHNIMLTTGPARWRRYGQAIIVCTGAYRA